MLLALWKQATILPRSHKETYCRWNYYQLLPDGTVREANLAVAALLGLDRSLVDSRRFGAGLAPACLQTFADFQKAVLASDTKQTCDIQLLRQGREARD